MLSLWAFHWDEANWVAPSWATLTLAIWYIPDQTAPTWACVSLALWANH